MPHTISVSLGPEWIKKAIVVSHERSGTHFLMNTLADSFQYVSYPWINMDIDQPINWWAADNLLSFLMSMKGEPVLNIVKSHHSVEFFLPVLEEVLEEFHLFYIYREPQAVMESLCRHLNAIPWNAGPKVESGAALAATEPSGSLLRYQARQYPNMRERLLAHQKGWKEGIPEHLRGQIIYVSFEDLRDRFEATVRFIGRQLKRAVPKVIIKPSREDRVVTPDGVWLQ